MEFLTLKVGKPRPTEVGRGGITIGGTSLCVYPASYYVTYFKGDHLVIINKEEIPWKLDEKNDLQINDSFGSVFAEIEKML